MPATWQAVHLAKGSYKAKNGPKSGKVDDILSGTGTHNCRMFIGNFTIGGGLKRILVVGGAGYIGSHKVRELLENGYDPLVFDNLSTGHADTVPTGRLMECRSAHH